MCWRCNKTEAAEQIADEDIKVFKIGYFYNNMFCSMFKRFHYQLNQLYSTNICITSSTDYYVKGTCGFHSYKSSIVKLNVRPYAYLVNFHEIMLDYSPIDNKYVKAECIIPKGSAYYENNMGEIISNQIVIKNVIPINRLYRM